MGFEVQHRIKAHHEIRGTGLCVCLGQGGDYKSLKSSPFEEEEESEQRVRFA